MKEWHGPALVLGVRNHAEADKLVTLYSREHGRLTAIAKSARKSKKRFVNKLEPFTLLSITCRPPRRGSLHFLTSAELIDANLGLRNDYHLYVTAAFICELLKLFSGEHDPDQRIFHLARTCLSILEQRQCPADILAIFFLLHLLEMCGYNPKMDACGRCGKKIDQERDFTLSPAGGCLICSHCHHGPQTSSLHISRQTLKFLLSGRNMELSRLSSLRMSKENSRQAIKVLINYSRHILQQDIHSLPSLLRCTNDTG